MISVQMIGNYLVSGIDKVFDKDIHFVTPITGISPLTMVGECDTETS